MTRFCFEYRRVRLGVLSLVLLPCLFSQSNMQSPLSTFAPRAGMSGCYAGNPFEMTARQSGTSDSPWISFLARNGAGSTRTDLAEGVASMIFNCETKQVIRLIHASKLAIVTQAQVTGDAILGFHDFPSPTNEFQNIIDVPCRRILLYADKEQKASEGEVWLSERFKVVMRDVHGPLTWEALTIKAIEPNASLFQVPPNYQKRNVDTSDMFKGRSQ